MGLWVGRSVIEGIWLPNSSLSPWVSNPPPNAASEEDFLEEFDWGFGLSREDK
jgi:hypothetical protein